MGTQARAGRFVLAGGLLAGGMAAVVGLAACGSSPSGSAGGAPSSAGAPGVSSFSSVAVPSALQSLASSGLAAASSRAAAAGAAASAFAASVDADTAKADAAARAELAEVTGHGNATAGEVGITGINRSLTGGLYAVTVNITNRSGGTASYAVKVDFLDSAGKVVDSDVVGAENLAPGRHAQPVAFSSKPDELNLVGRVARAQRY